MRVPKSKGRGRRTVAGQKQFPRHKSIIPMMLLIVVMTTAYAPLFSNSFIDYDDPVFITRNAHVLSGLTLRTLSWAWEPDAASGNWMPLTWIFHALDVDLFGLNPAGHHSTSLLIHLLNAILIFALLSRVTTDKWRAWFAAAAFGLHPLAVESVCWASEKKNVLCMLFLLLAIAAYGWYAKRPEGRRYLLLVIAFALGLAAKPMIITLPFVLLLMDVWPLARVKGYSIGQPLGAIAQRSIGQLLLEKLPLFALSAGSAFITVYAQSMAGAVASIRALPLTLRICNAIYSYLAYVLSFFWPLNLVPFYPEVPLEPWRIVLASLFIATISVVAWWQRKARPYFIVCWLFFLGTLVPVIGIVQVGSQARADRYMYVPMVGVIILIVWLVEEFVTVQSWSLQARVVVGIATLLILGLLSQRQVGFWHDDVSLWSRNIEITKNNVVAEDNLGIALLQQGNTTDALPHFYRATRLDPTDPISASNIATDLLSRGLLEEAVAKYQAVLADPRAASVPMLLPNIHSNLGSAFLGLGEIEQARDHYALALRLNPGDQVARAGLLKMDNRLSLAAAVHR